MGVLTHSTLPPLTGLVKEPRVSIGYLYLIFFRRATNQYYHKLRESHLVDLVILRILLIRSLQTASPRCRMDRKAVIAAYNANVRVILEYCSIVWAGAAKSHLTRLERVQHKFLIWLANRTNAHSDSLNYDDLLGAFGLKSLHARRTENDIVFLCKIFKGFDSSTCLLRSFCLHVPMRTTRNATSTLFHVPRGRVNCVANGLFVRCPRAANNFLGAQPQIDFLCDSIGKIKKHVALFTEPMRL